MSRLIRGVGFVLLSSIIVGCGTSGYTQVATNVGALNAYKVLGGGPSIPRTKAEFCLHRAQQLASDSKRTSALDTTLLVIAGITGGTGISLNAAAAGMDPSGTRTDVRIGGGVTTAVAAAVLALREGLGLRELARVERTAAGKNVEAAIRVLEIYALADDPKDAEDQVFAVCIASEADLAGALPGGNTQRLQALIDEARQAKAEAQATSREADDANKKAAAAAADVKKANDKLTEAQKALDEAKKKAKAATGAAVAGALAEVESASAAEAEAETKLGEAERQKAAADEAAKTAQCEATLKRAEAALVEKKQAFLQATGGLRRAAFFQTPADVTNHQKLVGDADADLTQARSELAKLRSTPCP